MGVWLAAMLWIGQSGGASSPPSPPSIRIGTSMFADYTVNQSPKVPDADGQPVTLNQFNIGRTYVNVTGSLSRRIAFRVTPEVTRETGTGTSLNGSYTLRLKYAYVQWNTDGWMPRGSSVRFGMQPTPWNEFIEPIYRYRFQGRLLEDAEGFLPTADLGASLHYVLPSDIGDVEAGVYDGEGYTHAEVNDQKALSVRASLRPLRRPGPLHGLRLSGFIDHDAYERDAPRHRAIAAVTYEHPRINAGLYYLAATDQPGRLLPATDAHGWSAWATPRLGGGWEVLARLDRFSPDVRQLARTSRAIAGLAYWFPATANVTSALLVDVDDTTFSHLPLPQPPQRRFALHALLNF